MEPFCGQVGCIFLHNQFIIPIAGSGQICNPGIAAIWEDENRRRATREGSPVDIPHLHSQRPPQNSTSSELFHLDRIHRLLNNQSQVSKPSHWDGFVGNFSSSQNLVFDTTIFLTVK